MLGTPLFEQTRQIGTSIKWTAYQRQYKLDEAR
jgi:hypothetical protein